MGRQEAEQRITDVTARFFRSTLSRSPGSVEVRLHHELLVVRVRGFLASTEPVLVESPGKRLAVEDHYARLFAQFGPLLRAGVREAAGREALEFQILLSLPEDECLFILGLEHQNTDSVSLLAEGTR